jgi:hypothetical protein
MLYDVSKLNIFRCRCFYKSVFFTRLVQKIGVVTFFSMYCVKANSHLYETATRCYNVLLCNSSKAMSRFCTTRQAAQNFQITPIYNFNHFAIKYIFDWYYLIFWTNLSSYCPYLHARATLRVFIVSREFAHAYRFVRMCSTRKE